MAQVPGPTPSLLWWRLGPGGSATSGPWAASTVPEVSGHCLTGFQSQVLLKHRPHRGDHTFGRAVHPWLILVNGTAKLPSAQNEQLDPGCPPQVHPWWVHPSEMSFRDSSVEAAPIRAHRMDRREGPTKSRPLSALWPAKAPRAMVVFPSWVPAAPSGRGFLCVGRMWQRHRLHSPFPSSLFPHVAHSDTWDVS